ncbi:21 kDa hemolysin precursor [hydrothermal vent metagenome]|uniref:21 kDa hemolysin n=1 Tax=hydrothermal vent metagenome TaxID=652676 RepID=A0A3B0Y7Z5_9ZZZZ
MKNRLLILSILLAGVVINSGCAPLLIGGTVATTVSVAHDRRTAGSIVEDNAIKLRISNTLRTDETLSDNSHISVTVFNGIVLLSGETPTEAFRTRAGEIARTQEKVRRVYNELTIAAPSSMMTRSSDSWITTKIKGSLAGLDIKNFGPSRVKVTSENGTVFLLGLVYRKEADATVDVSRKVSGVQRVVKLFEYLD